MGSSRRRRHRRKSWSVGDGSVAIRVGSRSDLKKFHEVQLQGARDAVRFARVMQDQVREFPRDPLIISVNGYQPWLEDVFNSSISDHWEDIGDLAREVQFAGTMQFPEKASKKGRFVPWTFILDQMNVPQVYYWSVGMEPPPSDNYGHDIENFRFRVGVWQLGRGACIFDREVSCTIIFTKPTPVSEHCITELMYNYLYKDDDFDNPREDEEGICWIFLRLYWLFTDWQNIISEIVARLDEAEANSHGRDLPVKLRARMMHNEIDRIYEMKEFLHFHNRAFRKLIKLKAKVPHNEQQDPIWADMDDEIENLGQYDATIDGLKERFNNLLGLEFNIQNATQSDNSALLAIIATLFLPISFVASLFGMSSVNWPAILYVYVAIPVVIISATFTGFFPWSVRRAQRALYPAEAYRVDLEQRSFTMLGDTLPDGANLPGAANGGGMKFRRKSFRAAGMDNQKRTEARRKSRTNAEKDDFD